VVLGSPGLPDGGTTSAEPVGSTVLLGHRGSGEVVHDDWVQPGGHEAYFSLELRWSNHLWMMNKCYLDSNYHPAGLVPTAG
jgi:hypothetical protein